MNPHPDFTQINRITVFVADAILQLARVAGIVIGRGCRALVRECTRHAYFGVRSSVEFDNTPSCSTPSPSAPKKRPGNKRSREIFTVAPDTRRKHVAIFGATGAGKTTLLLNMIA